MTTVHPQVQMKWDDIQRQLYSIEVSLWNIEQELAKVAVIGTYLEPSLGFTDASDTVALAHTKIGKIREALRDAEKGQQS
jgi:hypothetical protein